MILLDIFEVVVGTYLQLGASGLITDDDALRMELQGRDGPHLVDRTLHRLLQGNAKTNHVPESTQNRIKPSDAEKRIRK